MQKDIILRINLCTRPEIEACDDPLSVAKRFEERDKQIVPIMIKDNGSERPQHICEIAVPGACPRIQCLHVSEGQDDPQYMPCRLQGLIQAQGNESGFWVKLPCSECNEKRELHPITEALVHGEDAGRSA